MTEGRKEDEACRKEARKKGKEGKGRKMKEDEGIRER